MIYETFEGNKCIFFIGKCSKFSSVTLNFSEVYRNCFGSLKGCVTDITPSVTDITVCEFFLENYIMCTMMLKKLLISFIFMCQVYHQQYIEALKIK